MKKTKNMIIKESAESRELTLFLENNETFYNAHVLPIIKNLEKKQNAGKYDKEKAIILWYYAATSGAELYAKTYAQPGDGLKMFDVTARYTTAAALEQSFFDLFLAD